MTENVKMKRKKNIYSIKVICYKSDMIFIAQQIDNTHKFFLLNLIVNLIVNFIFYFILFILVYL